MWALLSACAHGGAGVCGCGADAQCVHCLLLHEPAPPQQKPTEEMQREKDSVEHYFIFHSCQGTAQEHVNESSDTKLTVTS